MITKPELNEGEVYGGAIINPDGSGHHFILLPGDEEKTWNDGMAWAKGLGGDLLDRIEQAMSLAHMPEEFQKKAYWSSAQHAGDSYDAWYQNFYYGNQIYYTKSAVLRVRAVRRGIVYIGRIEMATREHCQCGAFADVEHACPVTYAKLREQLAEANTRLSGQTCFVPPEFQKELDLVKFHLEQSKDCLVYERNRVAGLIGRSEAAEGKLRELSEQEPAHYRYRYMNQINPPNTYLTDELRSGCGCIEVVKLYTRPVPPVDVLVHTDDLAVDIFSTRMKEKLALARQKGRGGWENKTACTMEYLSDLLRHHVTKGDPVDVANFCMMLSLRDEKISKEAPPVDMQELRPNIVGRRDRGDGSRVISLREKCKDCPAPDAGLCGQCFD